MDQGEGLKRISEKIVGVAMRVHATLRPGLLEPAYEACLEYEPTRLGMQVEHQMPLPVEVHDVKGDCGYRSDLFVERKVNGEIKAFPDLASIQEAQLLSYLRLPAARLGCS